MDGCRMFKRRQSGTMRRGITHSADHVIVPNESILRLAAYITKGDTPVFELPNEGHPMLNESSFTSPYNACIVQNHLQFARMKTLTTFRGLTKQNVALDT